MFQICLQFPVNFTILTFYQEIKKTVFLPFCRISEKYALKVILFIPNTRRAIRYTKLVKATTSKSWDFVEIIPIDSHTHPNTVTPFRSVFHFSIFWIYTILWVCLGHSNWETITVSKKYFRIDLNMFCKFPAIFQKNF